MQINKSTQKYVLQHIYQGNAPESSTFAVVKRYKDNKIKKGKMIMVTLMVFAVVAVMIAQAINLNGKLS